MRLINIGFGNLVSSERLLTIVGPDSAPIKRMIQEARDRAMLIDASYGRKTRAVLLMDTDHVILSAIPPEAIARRLADPSAEPEREEEEQASARAPSFGRSCSSTSHCTIPFRLLPAPCGPRTARA